MAPPDAAVREAMRTRLGETMFVEAGAGSGKTTCLVDRFVALVEAGVEADRIAAITFTEKAAGELADRIRTELQKRSATSARCRAALPALDRAAICTLARLRPASSQRAPHRSRAAPRVTVLDEIASQLAFEMRWESFEDRIIEDPELERPLRLLLAARGPHRASAPGGACSSGRTGTWWKSGSAGWTRRCRRWSSTICFGEIDARRRHGHPVPRQRRQPAAPSRPRWPNGRRATAGRGGRRQPTRAPGLGAQLHGGQRRPDAATGPTSIWSGRRVRALGALRRRGARSGAAGLSRAHRRRAGPFHRRRGRGAAAGRASWSSTTCWCWPGPCCATRCTGWRCGRRRLGVINDSCSTSSRTPIPSRSSWRC